MKFSLFYELLGLQNKIFPVLFFIYPYYYGTIIILGRTSSMSMQNLYEQDILDHYQNPRNFGLLPAFDFISPLYNPSCGDSVTMCGTIDGNIVTAVRFEGKGCVLSLAMASMLTDFAQGKIIEEILLYDDELVEQLLKTQLGPKRLQCGMLPIQALQKGLRLYRSKAA